MPRCVSCASEVGVAATRCPTCGEAIAQPSDATVVMAAKPATKSSLHTATSIPDEGRFLPGSLVNSRYRVVGLIGRGGMGEVYRATDLTLAQTVALKFLPETGVSEYMLERFHSEVRIARQISHPNVCRVYDIGEVDGQPFLSMEYVDGEDLSGLLGRIGRLPAAKALEIARKICAGLAAAHDKGVIHRDLKPQNIMLNKRGDPVIMDFGLAAAAQQLTGNEARNGTPAYMSPEQLRGDEVTAKSDIYALGLVLYELFSGRRAWEAATIAELLKKQESGTLTNVSALATDVDPQIDKVLKRCLEANPAMRPATPLAVSAALPGGDPLAAALAAGEMPSPELVAASGSHEGIAARYAVPLFAFALGALIAIPWWTGTHSRLLRSPAPYSTAVAAHEARKFAATVGYTRPPADTWIGRLGTGAADYWSTHDRGGKTWEELLAAEPQYGFTYRESPEPLGHDPYGLIRAQIPPPVKSGMLSVGMTVDGRIREFSVVSAEKRPPPVAPLDAAVLFGAMGYNPADFDECEPLWIPLVNSDVRRAWKGKLAALAGAEVRIEAATLAGRLVSLRVTHPWSEPQREPQPPPRGFAFSAPIATQLLLLLGQFVAAIIALRNLKAGHGDRKGAWRVGLLCGLAGFIEWAGRAHHLASVAEINYLGAALSDAVSTGVMLALIYLALEPAVRGRWPQTLVSWSRLLAGKSADPVANSDVFAGCAVGAAMLVAFSGISYWRGRTAGGLIGSSLNGFGGVEQWASDTARALTAGVTVGLILFLMIFLVRRLLKNDYAAALFTAIFFASVENGGIWASKAPLMEGSVLLAIYAAITLAILKRGLLTAMTAVLFVNLGSRIDWAMGINGYSLGILAVLGTITIYSFLHTLDWSSPADEAHAT